MELAMLSKIKAESEDFSVEEFFIKNEPVFEDDYEHDPRQFDTVHKPRKKGGFNNVTQVTIKQEYYDDILDSSKALRPTLHYCDQCEAVFEKEHEMVTHKLQHSTNVNRFGCYMCGKNYVDAKSIRRHLLRIHNIEPPPGSTIHHCSECNEKFSDKSHLTRHFLKHSKERPHQCHLCEKTFSRKEHLNRHLVCVHGTAGPKKPLIPAALESPSDVKVVEEKDGMLQSLPTSEPVDGTLLHLQFSLQVPEVKKPTIIDPNSLPSSNDTVASTILPHLTADDLLSQVFPECQICHKKFIHNFHLTKHMEIHAKQFQCPVCDKKLSRKDHLKRHMANIHADTFSAQHFKCTYCPRHFSQKETYDKHTQLHLTSRKESHVCEICNHEYPTRWNLRKHKLHAHNIEPPTGSFKCEFCDRRFIDHYYVRRHMAKHNNVMSENKDVDPLMLDSSRRADTMKYENPVNVSPTYMSLDCDVIAVTDDEGEAGVLI